MNIRRAKEEIKRTVKAYLKKNAFGEYEIPSIRQRPILLMGPSGIGKTAVIEQAARECGVGLVSYTITHHTRQSAVGLPYIKEKVFGGVTHSVTEYTMSEIIASVYEKMEETGLSEGILFIDEINCASETLAPAMLQFLQCKQFGNQAVPEGWIIIAAGNPPEYNKSVKEFDVVTLDRVRKIEVEEDLAVWKEYASAQSVADCILSYLELRKENFYSFQTDAYGKRFVTARGWEDLSEMLKVCGELEIPVDYELIVQYLQDKRIAQDFADYYELYQKYRQTYRVEEILAGRRSDAAVNALSEAPFDERLSVTGLLLGALHGEFVRYGTEDTLVCGIYEDVKKLKEAIAQGEAFEEAMRERIQAREDELAIGKKRMHLSREDEQGLQTLLAELNAMRKEAKLSGASDSEGCFAAVKCCFEKLTKERESMIEQTGEKLSSAFAFVLEAFGRGQELVIFLTGLTTDSYAAKYLAENGSEEYDRYHKELLLHDTQEELKREIRSFKEEMECSGR